MKDELDLILDKCAKSKMLFWNLSKFKKTHSFLYHVIIDAMKTVGLNQTKLAFLDKSLKKRNINLNVSFTVKELEEMLYQIRDDLSNISGIKKGTEEIFITFSLLKDKHNYYNISKQISCIQFRRKGELYSRYPAIDECLYSE